MKVKTDNYTPWIVGITILLNSVIALLFFMPKYDGLSHLDLTFLPALNAVFNSFTTLFLLGALIFIKRKNITMHRRFIFAAFTSTFLFLITYVFYHLNAESTPFGGEGVIKVIYYIVLISHIVLAAPTVFLALYTAVFGYKMDVEKHRKIARYTMPIWLYVSITGVLVYLMISPYY
ncbi:membrane protein [Thermoactinomyces vulgaris]|uniref:Membrane protein n=1 Tax=Laceyella sediminis TaxID=573074 RepID=A0ABX5EKC1_9BACL|nr:DUF420 domain-containing protein [Laceyella sediminis]KPC73894.1 membrane protein [Thermoactinomyces vulgaris]PRZ12052.1 putative membrane protein [Laceyella sediminis]